VAHVRKGYGVDMMTNGDNGGGVINRDRAVRGRRVQPGRAAQADSTLGVITKAAEHATFPAVLRARLLRAAMTLARITPAPLARGLARGGAAIAAAMLRERGEILLENLERTAPNTSPAERRRLVRNTFRNIAECHVDLFRLPSRPPNELLDLMEIHGLEHLDAARAVGRGVIVVTGHLGNYELGGAWLAARGYPVHAMVEDVDPGILALLDQYRTATGMRTLSRNRGARDAYRVLKSGGILLLVADRVIGDTSDGVELPFCEGRRAVPRSPALLALAMGAPIVVGLAVRSVNGPRRYRIALEPPIMPDGTEPDSALALTRRITDRLAAAVREFPDQWFVFQPGWITGGR
jgi:KDO2-lipid IV(A) lauroyltransferase